ncbi:MAG: CDP-diacylglycerol--glycerol-3-phosphate 3-phosphatidyltransferase [Lachnospiraceae bacterium]|nr:CDP-diacylglycerol--glycerol-3-phosphate 3-phosphatidyltransferase [Lachnospiraceae bacterium]
MNLPNKLTLFRVILIPFFVVCLLMTYISPDIMPNPINDYVALGIFVVASLTDLLDGKIARARNLVTNFGKFMDPLADKLLVCSALICLIELGRIRSWMVIIIIAREFVISGFRLVAADKGVVIAASYWGKFKTTFQMIAVCLLILNIEVLNIVTMIVLWIAIVLTIVSLFDYILKNKDVIKDN